MVTHVIMTKARPAFIWRLNFLAFARLKFLIYILLVYCIFSLFPTCDNGSYFVSEPFLTCNRRSSEIQGTALGKCMQAWPVKYIYYIYQSMPAGVALRRHAFVGADDGIP